MNDFSFFLDIMNMGLDLSILVMYICAMKGSTKTINFIIEGIQNIGYANIFFFRYWMFFTICIEFLKYKTTSIWEK